MVNRIGQFHGAVLYAAMRFARTRAGDRLVRRDPLVIQRQFLVRREWLAGLRHRIRVGVRPQLRVPARPRHRLRDPRHLAHRADRRLFVAIGIAVLVAITDETRQSLTLTRTGSPWDVLLDGLSAWLGILVMMRMVSCRPENPRSRNRH
jgi:hypothetical protein